MKILSQLKDVKPALECKLARRFALYTVSISFLVALLISMMFAYKSYNDGIDGLKKKLSQVEPSINRPTALHLWQINLKALNIMTDALLMDRDIVYVKLLDEKGNTLVEKGKEPARYAIKKRIPVYHQQDGGKGIYLGELDYVATTEAFYEQIERVIIGSVIAIFIFFLIFTLLILFIYWESTVRYLLAIREYTNKIRRDGYKEEIGQLVLDRTDGHKDGKRDELDELVCAINDMHHEVIEQFTAIEHQSLHDELTGLPNRRMTYRLLANAITHCREANGYGALLSIDLDNFKLLNESMGHTVGDKILCEVANRLTAICNQDFQPARISGDEFLVLQSNIVSSQNKEMEIAEKFSRQLISNISQAITINGAHFKPTACVGIALFEPKSNPDVVVKQSDNALHHAKSEGPGHIAFFEPVMQKNTDKRLQLEQLIDKAVEKDLLFVHYQPKYDGQRKICSAEALVRMHDEEGGIVSPGEFIPVLEETGAIVKIGDHIIKTVFEFIQKYKDDIKESGLKSIAINVSPTQYSSAGFADRVIALSRQFDIDPKSIILEITEEVVASSIDNVVDVMHQLTQHGFRFSIDDFGTGYSSLRYLKGLPLGELKIDKSFVDDVTTDSRASAIVKTIIDMAHNLDLDVVAEGVETKDQFDCLAKYRCEQYQGFLFSRPLMEDDFLAVLQSNSSQYE